MRAVRAGKDAERCARSRAGKDADPSARPARDDPVSAECPRGAGRLHSRSCACSCRCSCSIFGLVLLATPALPIGLLLLYAAWWVYEKTGGRRDDERFTGILMLLGGLGAAMVFITRAWDAVRTLL